MGQVRLNFLLSLVGSGVRSCGRFGVDAQGVDDNESRPAGLGEKNGLLDRAVAEGGTRRWPDAGKPLGVTAYDHRSTHPRSQQLAHHKKRGKRISPHAPSIK